VSSDSSIANEDTTRRAALAGRPTRLTSRCRYSSSRKDCPQALIYVANRNSRTVEYTVGVIIPCMAPFAKLYKSMIVSVKTYATNRSYLRTNSLTGDYRPESTEGKNVSKGNQASHTNTIDKMLARMFPGEVATGSSTELTKTESMTETMKTERSHDQDREHDRV
jgi:hypothetical protein